MAPGQEEIQLNNLIELQRNNYLAVYKDSSGKSLVCQTRAAYIPFEVFQESFRSFAEIAAKEGAERFIFDKRSLRAFHQPSMEWYFIVWKQDLYRKCGLRIHRKILPAEAWFQKCVEAGSAEIKQKHPRNCFQELDISYKSSITEALTS